MEENKSEIKIIDQEVKLENTSNEFIEPKWMKILRSLMENKLKQKDLQLKINERRIFIDGG